MTGAAKIAVGSNTSIGENTWLNVNKRQEGAFAITIGENCFIGRRNFFTSGRKIVIRDYALTAIDCKFICANHVSDNPLLPYIASGVTYSDSIYVGVNCFFGAGATVLGNVSIGHGSVIGANALVTKDIPPFSIVVGSPARVLRRYSFSRQSWVNSDKISEADLLENPDEASYLAQLKATHPKIFLPLPAAGSNFGNI
jgi:acetyltransferase-like isoleucine patch superfamily enzyme